MAKVSISRIEPGTQVVEDVVSPEGTMLVREGTELTERHIQLMKNRGVEFILVPDDRTSATDGVGLEPRVLAERTGNLEAMFCAVLEETHMAAIYRSALERVSFRQPWD